MIERERRMRIVLHDKKWRKRLQGIVRREKNVVNLLSQHYQHYHSQQLRRTIRLADCRYPCSPGLLASSRFVLQIKLRDGTAKTLSFNATDTLQDVLAQLGSPTARLMTTFPKRIFTSADIGKTLKDLGRYVNSIVNAIMLSLQIWFPLLFLLRHQTLNQRTPTNYYCMYLSRVLVASFSFRTRS